MKSGARIAAYGNRRDESGAKNSEREKRRKRAKRDIDKIPSFKFSLVALTACGNRRDESGVRNASCGIRAKGGVKKAARPINLYN